LTDAALVVSDHEKPGVGESAGKLTEYRNSGEDFVAIGSA
jgi:hypothetical protein